MKRLANYCSITPSTVIEPPRTQNPSTSKKSESRSTHVTTLKLSTTKSGGGGGRVKKPTDVAALMTKNLEILLKILLKEFYFARK